jgi:hypothetical protein
VLPIRFGGNTALVRCDHPALHELLCRHFCHCLGATEPEVASYLASVEQDRTLRLQRDSELLYHGPQPTALVEYLMQDLTETLTASCRSHLVFHAAGLAHDGDGLVICGESGSGKSTLAAWLTAGGFDFITDEIVAVSLDLSTMSGLARPLHLRPGSAFLWQQCVSDSSPYAARLDDGSVLLDPESLRLSCVSASARPWIILFPQYEAGAPFVAQPLSPAEGLFRLLQRLINGRNLPDQGLSATTRLSQQVGAYCLTYSDLVPVAAWVKGLTGLGQRGLIPT